MNITKKEILITRDSVLMDIQSAFTSFFPFLKIQFLQIDKLSKSSSRSVTIDPNTSLKNLNNITTPQKISIENNRTVSEVSADFKNALGFPVQVSRKSGNVWNVISVTNEWTLESQNSAGKFISLEMEAPLRPN